jgi:hypothetical protein
MKTTFSTCPAPAGQPTKERIMTNACPARRFGRTALKIGLGPPLGMGLLVGLLVSTAQAESSAPTPYTTVLGARASLSPLSSMWQRHDDQVHHFHLGQSRIDLSLAEFDVQRQSARLFGDYYLTGPGFGSGQIEGGLRLTSGLAIGRAGAALAPLPGGTADLPALGRDARAVAQPYLGLGYSSLSLRAGWAFSADIGLGRWAATEGLRLGRGGPSDTQVERLLDDLRLSPVIQLGVRYAF